MSDHPDALTGFIDTSVGPEPEPCTECGGDHCSYCAGDGIDEYGDPCPKCDGRGHLHPAPCRYCGEPGGDCPGPCSTRPKERPMSEDPGVVAHNAARMRLVNLEEFLDRQHEGEDVDWAEIGALAEFDGCEDCVVREVLNAGLESLLEQGAIEIKEVDR